MRLIFKKLQRTMEVVKKEKLKKKEMKWKL